MLPSAGSLQQQSRSTSEEAIYVAQLGVNIVTNPTFLTDLSGWSIITPGAVVWEDGAARMNSPGVNGARLDQTPPVIPGRVYQVVVNLPILTTTFRIQLSTDGGLSRQDVTTPGLKQYTMTALGSDGKIRLSLLNAGTALFDLITIREVGASMSKVAITLRDYDGDRKQTSIDLGPVTDGASYVSREAEAAAIRDAVNAVAGNIAAYDFIANNSEPNDTNAATPDMQAHVRWIVELTDSVSGDGPYKFAIPTADLGNAALFLPSSTEHDPAAAEWIALKAAMNGIAVNYRTGSPFNVTRIYLEE
jgi:hypothetical protein